MNNILIFTGAGLSAESGISTFRDNHDGLWTKYDPMQVANIATFRKNRELVFDFYNERRLLLKDTKPNAAHLGIAELQRKYGRDRVKVFTQNIDDLLEQAGCEDVVHVHGKFKDMQCLNCGTIWDIGYTSWSKDQPCPHCDFGVRDDATSVKPGVVFFGEQAPMYPLLHKTFKNSRKDIIVVIGTSGDVINLRNIVGNRYSINRSFTVLNNKEYDKTSFINYHDFDEMVFEPASTAIVKIAQIIERKLEEK